MRSFCGININFKNPILQTLIPIPANLSPAPYLHAREPLFPLHLRVQNSILTRIAQVVRPVVLSIDSTIRVNRCGESLVRSQIPLSSSLSSTISRFLSHFLPHRPALILVETRDGALLRRALASRSSLGKWPLSPRATSKRVHIDAK